MGIDGARSELRHDRVITNYDLTITRETMTPRSSLALFLKYVSTGKKKQEEISSAKKSKHVEINAS